MGRGDQRSRQGKIWRGTWGKSRPRKKSKPRPGGTGSLDGAVGAPAAPAARPAPPRA